MTYQWKQKGVDHSEYRANDPENTLHGEAFKENGGYKARYLKDGKMIPVPDRLTNLGAAQVVVSGMVKGKSSVERV